MIRINSLIPPKRINDKYKVIPTYELLKPVIDDVMMQYVLIQLLNDETIPKNWFKTQDINNEKFRKKFKEMILKHIIPFLKSLFPFDKYDPYLNQNTPLEFIVNSNYKHNLSDIMDNIYDKLKASYNMNLLNDYYNLQFHNLQLSIYKSLLEPLIEEKTNINTRPQSLINYTYTQDMEIPPDILKKLDLDLSHRWDAKHPQPKPRQRQPQLKPTLQPKPTPKPKPTLQPKPAPKPKPKSQPKPKPKPQPKPQISTQEYILIEIVMKETDPTPKTKEEIDRLTLYYRRGREDIETVYNYYLQQHKIRFSPRPKKFIKPEKVDEFIKTIGYRSPNKVKSLIKNEFPNTEQSVLNNLNISSIPRFPLKENIKNYSLHHVSPPNTYIMDLIFENHIYCYLFLINVNTRKLWVEPTNVESDDDNNIKDVQKSSDSIIQAIGRIIDDGCKISYIKSDGERAFKSQMTIDYLNNNGIKIIEVPRQITKYPDFMQGLNMVKSIKTEPYHSSLSILDRVVRTIRDLAYNLKYDIITPQRMQQLVYIYNNTPHETLTHYAGQPTTPNQADSDPELQQYITFNIRKENYLIAQNPNFNLPIGSYVRVYNEQNPMTKRRSDTEPGTHRIIGKEGAFYVVEDEHGNTEHKTRIKLSY